MSDIKYNRIDEDLQQKIISNRESHWINPYAFKDEMAVRRNNDIDKANLWRPVFVRDVEKIMHLPYYNRYADKTQVFNINNISKILTNRRYIGNYIYKDVVIENGIPAIVPNDVFDKVQEMIAVNKRAPSRHKAVDDYLLTTKLYCGKCKSFMVGESGNARGRRYSYYKCVNTKRNKTCDKKAVKKDWIEDIVIYQVMKFINDDSLIEMLVNKILSIQGKESPMLKSLKKQLVQTDTAIENMLNAIEQGIITKSTKKRLDELERTKENLETEIAKENISHPLLTKEFLYSWFDGFKNFDVNKLKNRKMLIDTFVNSVVLYDDRIDFYFNFKDNAKSLTLSELNTVSDLSSSSPPKIKEYPCGALLFLLWNVIETAVKKTVRWTVFRRGVSVSAEANRAITAISTTSSRTAYRS